MLRKLLFAAASAVTFAASPAFAETWINYDGYRPIPPVVYAPPYGYPVAAYTDVTVRVPVVTYAPVRIRVYAIPQQPPYYNVPPYAVFAPY
ncbi:MAG: hypothetical protein WCF20_07205 [Methylovirgula sp.]